MKAGKAIHGRFQILGSLDQGGEGSVLESFDRWTGRSVCLKRPLDPARKAALLKEAELLGKLSSPCFPRLIDLIPDGPTLVLERKSGLTADKSPASDRATVDGWLMQLLQGLCELEELGYMHGDISPGNVLLSGSRAVLIDLGLARSLTDSAPERSGTLSTMAPEVIERSTPTAASDIFSLAVLACRMLSGSFPFSSNPELALEEMRREQARLPENADSMLQRALSHDPARRPTASEWLKHLLLKAAPRDVALLIPERLRLPAASGLLPLTGEVRTLHLTCSRQSAWQQLLDEWLLHRAALGEHWMRLDLRGRSGLRDWARSFLQEPARMESFPLLAGALNGSLGAGVLARQLLRFLEDQFDQPQPCFALIVDEALDDVGKSELAAFEAELGEQAGSWLIASVGQALPTSNSTATVKRLNALSRDEILHSLMQLPGLKTEEELASSLLGQPFHSSDELLKLLRMNLLEGRVILRPAISSLHQKGEIQGLRPLSKSNGLSPEAARALALCAAWLPQGPSSLWMNIVQKGREDLLQDLELTGWLRDRGDGCLVPTEQAPDLKHEDSNGQGKANAFLVRRIYEQDPGRHELVLAHLLRSEPQDLPTELSTHILLSSRHSSSDESRIKWIRALLPQLEEKARLALSKHLAAALNEAGRHPEAYELSRGLHRLEREEGGHLTRMIHSLRSMKRAGLAARLARQAIRATSEDSRRLELQAQLAEIEADRGRRRELDSLLERAASEAASLPAPLKPGQCYACNTLGACAFQNGRTELAMRFWRLLDRQGRKQLRPRQQVWLGNNLGVIHLQHGRLEQARAELEDAARLASRYHLDHDELTAQTNLALIRIRQGRPDQALPDLALAQAKARRLGRKEMELILLDHEGNAWAALGMLDQAEDAWSREQDEAQERGLDSLAAEACFQRLQLRHDLDLKPEAELLGSFLALKPEEELLDRWCLLESWHSVKGASCMQDGIRSGSRRGLLALRLDMLRRGLAVPAEELRQSLIDHAEDDEGLRHALRVLELDNAVWEGLKGSIALSQAPGVLLRVRLGWLRGNWHATREEWLEACRVTGEALELVEEMASGLSPVWRERLEASRLLRQLLDLARRCDTWLRREEVNHAHTA
jgi:predicted Ser/Thr protein kinase